MDIPVRLPHPIKSLKRDGQECHSTSKQRLLFAMGFKYDSAGIARRLKNLLGFLSEDAPVPEKLFFFFFLTATYSPLVCSSVAATLSAK